MARHLVLLQHGMSGSVSDFTVLESKLKEKWGDKLLTHIASSNDGYFLTWDGIENGGARLAHEVLEILVQHPEIDELSFIGHSLGGLYIRFCLGILHSQKLFSSTRLINYVSITTPHLGVAPTPSSLLSSLSAYIAPYVGHTGEQLSLQDAVPLPESTDVGPLLQGLVRSFAFEALSLFRRRVTVANVVNDFRVPYCTAAIVPVCPYTVEDELEPISPHYPHVKGVWRSGGPSLHPPLSPHSPPESSSASSVIAQSSESGSKKGERTESSHSCSVESEVASKLKESEFEKDKDVENGLHSLSLDSSSSSAKPNVCTESAVAEGPTLDARPQAEENPNSAEQEHSFGPNSPSSPFSFPIRPDTHPQEESQTFEAPTPSQVPTAPSSEQSNAANCPRISSPDLRPKTSGHGRPVDTLALEGSQALAAARREMLAKLLTLEWWRVDIVYSNIFAHEDAAGRWAGLSFNALEDVVQYIADSFIA
eukprot:GCRY01002798.1.p1 GENE.GCRY01002798.1~~GCRY01002798.1.p1  ORF type:complete len:480 (-),score=56.07 GCRY01002798.1:273-1712(-)